LFLRTSEFLWQEGHTAHATEQEAREESKQMLDIYQEVLEEVLAIPVLTGLKSEAERFAGAVDTYCIEAMMGDKKALQAGTSHYLGQNFAKAFDVKFQTENNKEELVYATSWGVSTRLVGALIMVHGDDKGLRLPPKVAPVQIVIIPIIKNENSLEEFEKFLKPFLAELKEIGIRFKLDDRQNISPGFKFNEWEMKGVPIRVEVGPRDMESGTVFCARRDTGEKTPYKIESAASTMSQLLEEIQINMFNQAFEFREKNTFSANSYAEFKNLIEKGGFIRCGWDGNSDSEATIKKETKATIRCILLDEKIKDKNCIYSGNPAKHEVIFARAY
jgi:prolyl-tRNA synthetase